MQQKLQDADSCTIASHDQGGDGLIVRVWAGTDMTFGEFSIPTSLRCIEKMADY
jgi:hypothetical protein